MSVCFAYTEFLCLSVLLTQEFSVCLDYMGILCVCMFSLRGDSCLSVKLIQEFCV